MLCRCLRTFVANCRPNAVLSAIETPVDTVDRKIVAELVRDGRLSNVELADRVNLTPGPCLRRVQRLQADGVITGYTARVNPAAIGRSFEVFVNVELALKDRHTVEEFEESIAKFDEVIEVRRMFGLPDYFVRVAVADLESYEAFVSTRLTDVPGVARIDSHLTMKTVKAPDRPA
jgi:DNA-binding Lrp family transcriptional regulator